MFSGGYNYLHVGKPGLDVALETLMAQAEYVSTSLKLIKCIWFMISIICKCPLEMQANWDAM